MTTVRPATRYDLSEIASWLPHIAKTKRLWRQLLPDPEDVWLTLLDWLKSDRYFVFVAERDARMVGFLAGVVTPHVFNPNVRVTGVLLWYVAPRARGSRAAKLLLETYLDQAASGENTIVTFSHTAGAVSPRSLERMGLRLTEHAYLLEA